MTTSLAKLRNAVVLLAFTSASAPAAEDGMGTAEVAGRAARASGDREHKTDGSFMFDRTNRVDSTVPSLE